MLFLYMSFIDDNNDKSKFEIIYYTYRKRMLVIADSVLHSKEDAEDVVHDTFIKIARNIKSIDDPKSDKTLSYVLKATKNNAINLYNKNNKIKDNIINIENIDDLPDNEFFEKLDISNNYNDVVKAILSLDEKYKDVLFYHFVQDMNSDDYIKNLFEAYKQYFNAYQLNSKDLKTLTCLASCILKIFDTIINIYDDSNGRYKNISTININEIDKKLKSLNINYTSVQLIESAYRYLSYAFLIDNTNIEAHYHMIHVNMYQYLLTEKKEIFKENGLKEIENVIALSFGKGTPKSFKYKARNFYYAIEAKEKAEEYENQIKSNE